MTEIRIRFRHLQSFLAIAQTRSVVAAAEALRITQPALSKTLRELEDALEAKLFVRDKKGMLLSGAGEIFLQHAASSVASMRGGIEAVRQQRRTHALEIRIGVLPNVSASLGPRALRRFKETSAESTVRVVTGDNAALLDQLRIGQLEMVIGRLAQPEFMIGLAFEPLFDEPLTIAVRRDHPLSRVRRFKLGMISNYSCVMPYRGTIIRHEIDRYLLSRGIVLPNDLVDTTSIEFGIAYTQLTDAVWFVPASCMRAPTAAKNLVELPFDNRLLRGPVGITTRADAKKSAVRDRMIEAFREAAHGIV